MLREFMYRYVGEVLKESQVWAEYRTGAPPNVKVELDLSDIQMAVEHKIKHKNGKDRERWVISRARQYSRARRHYATSVALTMVHAFKFRLTL